MIRFWKNIRDQYGRKPLLVLVAAAVVVTALTVLYAAKRERGSRVSPKKGPIVEAIYALGTVKADATYTLKVGVAMSVIHVAVAEGDVIGRGAPLLTTDSATFTSPIAGTVTRIAVQKGETVWPGGGVITVMDLTHKYIQVSLDQQSALLVRVGQPVELSFESIRGQKIKGKINRMYPSDGQFLVRVQVEAMPAEILPDMTADVAIEVARREDALLIPVAAVNRGTVTLYRNGHKQRVTVKVGAISAEWAEVQEGEIQLDDQILVPEQVNPQ